MSPRAKGNGSNQGKISQHHSAPFQASALVLREALGEQSEPEKPRDCSLVVMGILVKTQVAGKKDLHPLNRFDQCICRLL